MRWRFSLLFAGVILAYGILGVKLYTLQVKKGAFYAARAASQAEADGSLRARRGSIYLTDKNYSTIPLAIQKEYPLIYAVPKEITDPSAASKEISGILGLEEGDVRAMLSKPDDEYEELLSRAGEDVTEKIRTLHIPGIYITVEEHRLYPFGGLAAQVVGFVGPSGSDDELKGRYGLEKQYDDRLRGTDGRVEGDRIVRSLPGQDVEITLDRNIQARSEEILKELIRIQQAAAGLIIVQEPSTGKILAIAGAPAFDPNHYSQEPFETFLNPAVQGIYEPGSIFKIITMAAGIDAGAITPETTYYDNGTLTLNGRKISNWDQKAHGRVTMTEVIEQSINTGAAFAVKEIGYEKFLEYLERFGVEVPTGVALPGELKGSIKNLREDPRAINFATAAYGQGVAVTPLRLISMVSAIANKGLLMKPLILAEEKPAIVRRVVAEHAAREVTDMMVSAVTKAKVAAISGYRIAGKTGTAQIPDFKKGGYSDQFIHTYAGFPAENPRFSILVKLDKPKFDQLAGATVVPAFRELAQFILNYYTIPPDAIRTDNNEKTSPIAP